MSAARSQPAAITEVSATMSKPPKTDPSTLPKIIRGSNTRSVTSEVYNGHRQFMSGLFGTSVLIFDKPTATAGDGRATQA